MIIRISNMYDATIFKEQIEQLQICVQDLIQEKLQILVDAYGNYFESAFGSAEIYIITDTELDISGKVRKILDFYNINPDIDVPEYSDVIGENHLQDEHVYTETFWLVGSEKPVLIIACEEGERHGIL